MAATSQRFAGSSITNIVHRGKSGAGPFMLTLCRLLEPIAIRPPQAPHLKPFTFFTSRARQRDGSDHIYLHMGFFDTLADAERWVRAVRGRHPEAVATIAPPTLWQESTDTRQFAPVNSQSLTDTQVLDILETRRPIPPQNEADEQGANEQIELLRPDDTVTRLALKDAVARGAAVSFAVQLHWSVRPIDLSSVSALAIFKAYSLYTVESRRTSRSCYFLRLGFFGDPVSAKQVALHVRSTFASAAVVPVLDEEIAYAREACMDIASVPSLVQQRVDEQPELARMLAAMTVAKSDTARQRRAAENAETLEQTLAQLAEREMWNDPDVLSDTGVRHLKVEIQGRSSNRRH